MENIIYNSYTADSENIYWLFSASAQSISALIAILLTGFAIVLSIMISMEQKDETLTDILHSLKLKYYKIIIILSLITGAAIILSLYSIYINNNNFWYANYVYIISSILDIVSILGGILFMIYIINPDKYKILAMKLYIEEKKVISVEGKDIDGIEFLKKFINLEKLIRDIVEEKAIYVDKQFIRREILSLRNMAEILWRNGIINRELHDKIIEVNKFRNLVVHGKIDKVDNGLIQYLDNIFVALQNSYNDFFKQETE